MHTILSYGMGVDSTAIMWNMKVKLSCRSIELVESEESPQRLA